MKWFGESWGAPCCDPEDHVETPDGEACPGCIRSIRPGDCGFVLAAVLEDGFVDSIAWHRTCFIKTLIPDAHHPNCATRRSPVRACDCIDLEDV